MKQQDSPLSLGTDSLSTLLMRYALPSIIAMVSSSLYNMIDSIFIGHGVGPLAISGLALTMPLMNLAAAFGAMVGVGSAALTSIRLGQGNKLAADAYFGQRPAAERHDGSDVHLSGTLFPRRSALSVRRERIDRRIRPRLHAGDPRGKHRDAYLLRSQPPAARVGLSAQVDDDNVDLGGRERGAGMALHLRVRLGHQRLGLWPRCWRKPCRCASRSRTSPTRRISYISSREYSDSDGISCAISSG